MEVQYPAMLEQQEDGSYFVQFIDLPDAITEGKSLDEALFNASEVLSAMLAWRMDEGKPIEAATTDIPEAHYIAPDAKTQAALLMRQARGDRTYADLARALETSWDVARRLEDPNHWPTLRALDRAAAALGKRLVLSLS